MEAITSSSSTGGHKHHNHALSPTSFLLKYAPLLLGVVAIIFVTVSHYSVWDHSRLSILDTQLLLSKDKFIAKNKSSRKQKVTTVPASHPDKEQPDVEVSPSSQTLSDADTLGYNGVKYHVVFSTSCSDQMHWESYVLFYHAYKVNQPGTVTRIASGCNPEEAIAAQKFHKESIQTMSTRFYLHLTPDYSREQHDGTKGKAYKYMNKPFGLLDFLENVLHMNATTTSHENEDSIIILIDPDIVLLRPLLHDFSNEDVIWVEDKPATKYVRHGYPMGQQDGYLDNRWMHLNGSYITGDPNIGRPEGKQGPLHYNSGPPYLATAKDMYEITKLWVIYAPRVNYHNPGLFAEMQGYIWATYKLKKPHTFIKSIVVSTTTGNREGWPYIDQLPDDQVCSPPQSAKLPIGMHYCKRYALGPDYFFSKYRLKKNFLNCEKNLMKRPPKDIGTQYDYFIAPPPATGKVEKNPEKKSFSHKQAKREAFMLCGMINAVNEAAIYYKKNNCGDKGNFNETYTIRNDPTKY